MEGRVISGSRDAVWSGASLDSRQVEGGELFFALPGERTDGHRYVADALARGAGAAVVHQTVKLTAADAAIRVDDSLTALHRLTRVVRERLPRQLVAITGSVGKTTTKELLATMLGSRFRVARNPGNLNNLLGFPIALLGIPEDTEWMVAEMGMSTPGELRRISQLGRPDVAVFTKIRPVHLEFFGSLRAIAEAKAELLEGLRQDGLVVANRDDPEIERIVARHAGDVVWYSVERDADYWVEDVQPIGDGAAGSRFTLATGDLRQRVILPLHGRYNVENSLAAAACAHTLGVELEEIAAALEATRPLPMRGVVHGLSGGGAVVDDSYNSNPAALTEALLSALLLPGSRHWAVLGDMLELGETAVGLHRQAGQEAAEAGYALIVGVGELAREIVAGALARGADGRWYEDAAAAAEAVPELLGPQDVVLVKGSRGIGLEQVVRALLARERGEV
jgi:UDP-N-acetylmuramoyl-tripeptide--D-alanyl-D-alanine ligase